MSHSETAKKDWRDVIAGALLTALGLFVAIYAQRYEIGCLSRMGPGFFPVVLGIALAVLGLMVAVPAWFRTDLRPVSWPVVRWRVGGLVIGSVVLFAAALEPLGVILSTFGAVCVSSAAARDMTWQGRIKLAAAVAVIAYAIFVVGLKMPLSALPPGF